MISSSSTRELSLLSTNQRQCSPNWANKYSQNMLSKAFWTPNIASSLFDEYPKLGSRSKGLSNGRLSCGSPRLVALGIFGALTKLKSAANDLPIHYPGGAGPIWAVQCSSQQSRSLRTNYVGLGSTNTPKNVREAKVRPIKNGLCVLIFLLT